MSTFTVVCVVWLTVCAFVLLLLRGMHRVSAHADEEARWSFRSLVLSQFARRRGDRRRSDRRARALPVVRERRAVERRRMMRRRDPTLVDNPVARPRPFMVVVGEGGDRSRRARPTA